MKAGKYIFFLLSILIPASLQSAEEITYTHPVNCTALNTSADEFAPVWNPYDERLYFNSTKSGKSMFYKSRREDSTGFSDPDKLLDPLNVDRNNQSYITFINSNEALLSTFKLYASRSYLNLFKTYREKNSWVEPVALDSLNAPAFLMHPSVSPDGNILVYSSDFNSEYKDTDIWMAYRIGGSWGAAVRLDEINSPGNEITPFLKSEDSLYFATNGQEGPGGYDIFLSVKLEGIWQRPELVPSVNSEFDDSDPCILQDGSIIFASDRAAGAGGLDLYISNPVRTIKEPAVKKADVDIDFETLVTSIRTKNNFRYQSYPVIPYIFSGDEFSDDTLLTLNGIDNSLEPVYSHSPAFIAKRLESDKKAQIYLFCTKCTDINDYPEMLSSLGEISPEQVIVMQDQDFFPEEIKFMDLIYMLSEDENLLRPMEIGKSKIVLIPPVLEIFLTEQPANTLKNVRISAIAGGKEIKNKDVHPAVPGKVTVDLNPLSNELIFGDSLIVRVTGYDNADNKISRDLVLPVTHMEIREKITIESGRMEYDPYIFFFAGKRHLRQNRGYMSMIEEIAEKTTGAEKLIVQYFSEDEISIRSAEALQNELQKEIPTGFPVTIEYKSASEYLTFPEKFSKFVIRVLIQKYKY